MTAAMTTRMRRSLETVTPKMLTSSRGSSEVTVVTLAPYRSTAAPCTTMRTPSVATMRASGDACAAAA